MAEKDKLTTELSRDLTLFHLTMMGMGMMIGAGVFLGSMPVALVNAPRRMESIVKRFV